MKPSHNRFPSSSARTNPLQGFQRTALTYIDADGNWHSSSKGAPEQIMNLCNMSEDARKKVHAIIDKFTERGLHSLAVARQVSVAVPGGSDLSIRRSAFKWQEGDLDYDSKPERTLLRRRREARRL
ncbi:hypothetical protein PIB30_055980 [Stylosanthes scabra]|uniref:Uncharacterized protein n=1 Tax=Stylosanthes scabra TaxID=79078 RepID=A0ABU6UI09_9FABA|nr:hypothetical protein [Stylosanthes scabra]